MSQNYEVGTRAWQPDPEEGWMASEVEEKIIDGDKVTLIFLLANGEVINILPMDCIPRSLTLLCTDKNNTIHCIGITE